MALEPFRVERQKNIIRPSLILILFWGIWLAFVSSMHIKAMNGVDGTALMLIIGAFWWTPFYAAWFILAMSGVYSAFSLTPAGLFWVVAYGAYLALYFVSFRFTIQGRLQLAATLFAVSLLLHVAFASFTAQILGMRLVSMALVGKILLSSLVQSGIGIVFARPFLRIIEAK